MGASPRPYDGQTDQELMDLAKRIMAAWVAEPIGSVERAMKAAAHESVMTELKRRIARKINVELGLPDVDL
jgi:hypothetical protein